MRAFFQALMALPLAACAAVPVSTPVNVPLAAPISENSQLGVDGDALALSFSGGGARAAAFSYGVLLGLRDMRNADRESLLDEVTLITAVSGGAITAGWYGLHGQDGLDGFRAAALDKDWESEIHTSFVSIGNLACCRFRRRLPKLTPPVLRTQPG